MFTVTIPHPKEGNEPIVFETEDRKISRMAYIIGKALGVDVKVVVSAKPREVKFKGV